MAYPDCLPYNVSTLPNGVKPKELNLQKKFSTFSNSEKPPSFLEKIQKKVSLRFFSSSEKHSAYPGYVPHYVSTLPNGVKPKELNLQKKFSTFSNSEKPPSFLEKIKKKSSLRFFSCSEKHSAYLA